MPIPFHDKIILRYFYSIFQKPSTINLNSPSKKIKNLVDLDKSR